MTLINCPECGREISDKVKACPHCGFPFENQFEENQQVQKVEISSVKLQNTAPEKKKKVITYIVISAAVIIAAIIIGVVINSQTRKNYVENINSLMYMMLDGGAEAESLANLTSQVWFNSIYEESDSSTDKYTQNSNGRFYDDFNDALSSLFSAPSTKYKIKTIEDNQDEVAQLMKDMQNPPRDLQTCYDTLTKLYTAYRSLTDLAIDPSGSLQTFAENKNNKIDTFLDLYHQLEAQIPD